MLKNKMKTIALVLVMILSLTMPLVSFAEENAENDIMLINETENTSENATEGTTEGEAGVSTTTTTTTSSIEETFKKSDVYLTGSNVTIDYIVDGNLFVIADTVTINSQIGGDAFIFANTVIVGEEGYIFSNLFTVANNVEVNGIVYDLYSVSENLLISGYVYRDVRVTSQSVNIAGTVGRNAYISCGSLTFTTSNSEEGNTFTNKGIINGNLEYSSENEVEIPDGSVTGEVKFSQETTTKNISIQNYLLSLGRITVTAILIWLLCLWLAPKFLGKTSNLITKKPLKVIGLGIVTPIILIIASIILMILGLTSIFGILLLTALFILVALATSIFIITVNNLVCSKLNITKNVRVFGMLVATSIVLWLIGLIPYIGGFVGFVGVIIGIGIIIANILDRNSKKQDKEEQKDHD